MKETTSSKPNRNTKLLTISMPADDKKTFDEFCETNMTNKSRLISWLIQQHLNELKKEDVK